MKTGQRYLFGFCSKCEHAFRGGEKWRCPECGERLEDPSELEGDGEEAVRFAEWSHEVHEKGLWGPSPGGAVQKLDCSRAMIQKLVNMNILEESRYERGGHLVIMISARSIAIAKKNKEERGTYSGRVWKKGVWN
ncbi:MAG: hypothetical protein IMZ69_00915 [Spirochaetes bacterium]|nr:hypothetical protein [Spirochaetota bacterium]